MNTSISGTGQQPPTHEVSSAPFAIHEEESAPITDKRASGITFRVVAISLLLAVFFGYVIPIIDVKTQNTFLGAAHLPPGAIGALLIMLVIVNPLLKLFSRHWTFSRNEVLTIYITCLFSCLVPGHGGENFFVPNIIGPFYFATRENKWLSFLSEMPSWFSPALHDGSYMGAGRSAVEGWFTGIPLDKQVIPWAVWLMPLLAWSALIIASYFMLACLSVILRGQWSDREALAFPLLRLPMEMTEDVDRPQEGTFGRFFKDHLMWLGFGIAVFIQLMNGLNLYITEIPKVPLEIATAPLFVEPPWNQIGSVNITVFPIVVGITYLLTTEISFSLWFFFWFIKLQYLAAYYLGFAPSSLPSAIGSTAGAKVFVGYQQVGCYLAYVAIVFWTGRAHFAYVARRAFGRVGMTPEERDEAMSYPVAFWGFIFSFAFLIAWSIAAGVAPQLAVAMWLTYLIIAIALTRVVAEGGLLFVQQGWTTLGTLGQLFNAGGMHWLIPGKSLAAAAIIQNSMMVDMRAFVLPSFVQSFKLARDRHIRLRPLLALIFAVTIITLAMSTWMNVRLGYSDGGLQLDSWFANAGPQVAPKNAADLAKGARDMSVGNWGWLGLGTLTTYGLMLARSRFLWFPLHPIGFLMCLTYPMMRLWFSIFLGWMFKIIITRFGGGEVYRKATPLFLGLALGDVAMMLFWLIVDGWLGHSSHKLMPS